MLRLQSFTLGAVTFRSRKCHVKVGIARWVVACIFTLVCARRYITTPFQHSYHGSLNVKDWVVRRAILLAVTVLPDSDFTVYSLCIRIASGLFVAIDRTCSDPILLVTLPRKLPPVPSPSTSFCYRFRNCTRIQQPATTSRLKLNMTSTCSIPSSVVATSNQKHIAGPLLDV
jgi:hypothetical protein